MEATASPATTAAVTAFGWHLGAGRLFAAGFDFFFRAILPRLDVNAYRQGRRNGCTEHTHFARYSYRHARAMAFGSAPG